MHVPLAIRKRHELAIMSATVKAALKAGYRIAIDIGDGLESEPSDDYAFLMQEADAGDDARMYFYKGDERKWSGWAYFVLGNSGYDVLSDYTTSLPKLFDCSEINAAQRAAQRDIFGKEDHYGDIK